MGKAIKYQDKLIESLKDHDEAILYLNAALEDGDIRVFLLALRNVVEANGGVTTLAKASHKSRTSLYKALSETGNPYLKSTKDVLNTLGFQLTVSESRRDQRLV